MTINISNIIPAKFAEDTRTKQYESPDGKTIVDSFTVTNSGTAVATFTCNLVAVGDSADSNNTILESRGVAVGETYTCPELIGQVLENGSFISTLASASDTLVIRASGREITD